MKKVAVLVLIAVFLVPSLASAQAPVLPGSGWWTGEQVQNVGTADATIVVTAYDSASSSTYVASSSAIATGASANFNPASFTGMPAGFQGSAVVSSDQPLAAVVNVTNRQAGSYGVAGGLAGGQYQGVNGATAGTPVRFPIAKNAFGSSPNIKTTTFFVQNAGTAAASVAIAYVCTSGAGAGNTYNYSTAPTQIQPGQMVVLGPAQAGVPANTLCSATATAGGQPLAGVATEHYATEAVASLLQVTRAMVPADYATTIYAPIFKNRYPASGTDYTKSRTVGVQVQNVSGGVADIKATYYAAGGACPLGTTYTTTASAVADGAAFTFINPSGMPNNCLASAKFEGFSGGSSTPNANIVGIANESYLSPAPAPQTQASTAYFALPATGLTNKLGFPLYKEKYGNKTTGVQVQNTAAVTATIHVEFKVGTTTYTTANQDVAPGSSANFTLVSNFAAGKWVGAALPANSLASMTVFSNQPVVGVANETPWYSSVGLTCFGQAVVTCYDKQNYEGFNLP